MLEVLVPRESVPIPEAGLLCAAGAMSATAEGSRAAGRGGQRADSEERALRVLCVDDSPTFRAVLMMTFAGWPGVEVLGCPLDALRRCMGEMFKGTPFDALVLDVEMTPISGVDLAHRIRELPAYRDRPIFFLTGLESKTALTNAALSVDATLIAKGRQTAQELRAAIVREFRDSGLLSA